MTDLRDDLRTYFDFVADEVRAGPPARRRRPRALLAAAAALLIAVVAVALVLLDDSSDRPQRLRTATSLTTEPAPVPTTIPVATAERRVAVFDGLPRLDASISNGTPVPIAPAAGINGPVFDSIDGLPWVSLTLPGGTPFDALAAPLDGSVAGLHYRGDAISIAETADAYWLYVREFTNTENQYRLLRYRKGDTEPSADTPVPTDGQPAGGLVVTDDALWIPLRSRLARVDVATGDVVAAIPMDFQDGRTAAAVDGTLIVSDNTGIRIVDPTTNTLGPRRDFTPTRVVSTSVIAAAGRVWVALSNGQLFRLDAALEPDAQLDLRGPSGDVAVQAVGDRMWATTYLRIGVAPTATATDQVVMLTDPAAAKVTKTVVIHAPSAQAWIVGNRVLLSGFPLASGPSGALDPTLYAVDLG